MPIKPSHLQRRHAELGRIRLGHKASTQSGGTRPAKLERFRFTSVSEGYIKDLAELYGGQPRPWDNSGIPSWEVYTEAASIPVIAVKGGLSQWMEFWSGGGCLHRCDGETNVLTGEPCDLEEQVQVGRKKVNPHAEAKPTTRLSLMLPELDAIGVWRMESKGWNAAAEIPAVAELAQFVGDLVPAELHLVERRAIKDGETSRFVVPVLDLKIGAARLREVVAAKSGGTAELGGPTERPALSAGSAAGEGSAAEPATGGDVSIPTPEQIAEADLTTLRRMQDYLGQHGISDHPAMKALLQRIDVLEDHEDDQQPDADGVVEGEWTEDPPGSSSAPEADAEAVWQQILFAAGERGMSTPDLEDDFARRMGGVTSDSASVSELQHYLGLLTNEQVPA